MSDRSSDIAAIERVIALQEDAFNTKDAERFAEPWRERSWAVNVSGVELEGREAMLEAARHAFAGPLADQYARYEPGTVEFLHDDVTILHVYARAVTADGMPIDVGHSMIALYVLVREEERWQIVARQNTLVTT
jgi:uncharacterized protein (TIGR02246 family)